MDETMIAFADLVFKVVAAAFALSDLVFKVVAAGVAAYWAFFKWGSEREKDRKLRSALYLNPYLFACEELQSRIWNILDNKGLSVLRGPDKEKPDLSYVDETLYLIAQYFGWQHCIYRYYPHDANMMKLALRIRDTFATDEYGTEAFCFFRPEQRFLGQMIMQRSSGEFGGEFDVMAFEDFKQKLDSDFAQHPPVQKTRKKLKAAESVGSLGLEARVRLATIQNDLVDLLNHIEKKEHVLFFFSKIYKERKKAKILKIPKK